MFHIFVTFLPHIFVCPFGGFLPSIFQSLICFVFNDSRLVTIVFYQRHTSYRRWLYSAVACIVLRKRGIDASPQNKRTFGTVSIGGALVALRFSSYIPTASMPGGVPYSRNRAYFSASSHSRTCEMLHSYHNINIHMLVRSIVIMLDSGRLIWEHSGRSLWRSQSLIERVGVLKAVVGFPWVFYHSLFTVPCFRTKPTPTTYVWSVWISFAPSARNLIRPILGNSRTTQTTFYAFSSVAIIYTSGITRPAGPYWKTSNWAISNQLIAKNDYFQKYSSMRPSDIINWLD